MLLFFAFSEIIQRGFQTKIIYPEMLQDELVLTLLAIYKRNKKQLVISLGLIGLRIFVFDVFRQKYHNLGQVDFTVSNTDVLLYIKFFAILKIFRGTESSLLF